jgi:hypothetical protein
MAAKGRIVNTTPKGKHSLERTRFTVLYSGGTYSRERNSEKRTAREAEAVFRAHEIAKSGGKHVPKRHLTRQMIGMLSDRRLRQLIGRRYV